MAEDEKPQVIVAQLGARRHYAIPVILHHAGMLAHFYTDAFVGPGSSLHFLKHLRGVIPAVARQNALLRLLERCADDLPPSKITAFNRLGLSYVRSLRQAHGPASREEAHLSFGERFCELIVRHNSKSNNESGVYAFPSAAWHLFQWAGKTGRFKILDQFILPKALECRLMEEENSLWPGWEEPFPSLSIFQPRIDLEKKEWQTANAIVCGSTFVAQGLNSLGVKPHKIHVVPSGINTEKLAPLAVKYPNNRPLRILFLGEVALRKGVQYLDRALGLLNSFQIEARLVGNVAIKEPYCSLLGRRAKLAGLVPRSEVRHYYEWADIFVFPSLCEGSALVTYEALAAGLPVITTFNTGSVVRDGEDGFIVPIRDAEALADKIELLSGNQELRNWMSRNARKRSLEFTWEKYGTRLTNGMIRAHSEYRLSK